jgi:hypothetical protein
MAAASNSSGFNGVRANSRPEHDARRVFSISRREKLRTCGLQPHYGWLENGVDDYDVEEIRGALIEKVSIACDVIDFIWLILDCLSWRHSDVPNSTFGFWTGESIFGKN